MSSIFDSLEHAELLEDLHARFLKDPASLEPSWRHFFEGMEFGKAFIEENSEVSKDLRLCKLVDAYRTFGHFLAQVNPVEITKIDASILDLQSLGFEEKELDDLFPTIGLLSEPMAPLRKIIQVLKEIYCRSIGVEYMGISPALEKWLQKRIEPSRFHPSFALDKKREILRGLNRSELFEIFLHTKYVGQKRFSIEGGETLIPLLQELVDIGSTNEMEEVVIGMAHRGRLNVLANILGKSFSMIFGEFEDFLGLDVGEGVGDVKYHKGFSSEITTKTGKKIHIALTANPSHLESVDPVTEGKTFAKQIYHGDIEKKKIIPVLIHGDASIAGQGVVYETMQLYRLAGYCTGGTIHIVVNNNIGFTTLPQYSRSTHYCTDIAKTFQAPVFHVNAENPEECVLAMQLAFKIRQEFHTDVFIDMNCYRKYGHNEGDEPFFTQPLQYKKIRAKRSIREMYRDRLIQEGVVEKKMAEELEEEFKKGLHQELDEIKLSKETFPQEAFGGIWEGYHAASLEEIFIPANTAVSAELLLEVANAFCKVPNGLTLHPKVLKLQEERLKMLKEDAIDWGMGEHLALGTLLWQNVPIRLAGQDSCRGTFSQRHAKWIDQDQGKGYIPLAQLRKDQGRFDVIDSSLSEFASLGFEFGYSLSYPSALVIWEGQFGDFANGAQIIIDQYVSTAEQKWLRFSGLTLLLPHGYEGQGPEHSSARLERFLQLAGNGNMQIVNPTTPAQYFHLLRRQALRKIRKPLVVFTPKGLLRHPQCLSPVKDFTEGTFEEILDDAQKPQKATRVLLCQGRIYYDLLQERERQKREDVAIVRIEQLYPLHEKKLQVILKSYSDLKEIFWVQEEPQNMGAWSNLFLLFLECLPKEIPLQYIGRQRSASPATGSHKQHQKEQKEILEKAFQGSAP